MILLSICEGVDFFFHVRKINCIISFPCFGYFKIPFTTGSLHLLSLKKSIRINIRAEYRLLAAEFMGSEKLSALTIFSDLFWLIRLQETSVSGRIQKSQPASVQRALAWETQLSFLICEIRGRMR